MSYTLILEVLNPLCLMLRHPDSLCQLQKPFLLYQRVLHRDHSPNYKDQSRAEIINLRSLNINNLLILYDFSVNQNVPTNFNTIPEYEVSQQFVLREYLLSNMLTEKRQAGKINMMVVLFLA